LPLASAPSLVAAQTATLGAQVAGAGHGTAFAAAQAWCVGAGRGLAAAHGTTHGLSMAGTRFLAGATEKHGRERGFAKRFAKSTGSCEEANSLEESEEVIFRGAGALPNGS
jgi:hypothetical protein